MISPSLLETEFQNEVEENNIKENNEKWGISVKGKLVFLTHLS